MKCYEHDWVETCDTVRECFNCGELQFGTGKPWSFETVVDGNPSKGDCASVNKFQNEIPKVL